MATKIAARLAEGGPLVLDTPGTAPPFTTGAEAWLEWYPTLYALREPTQANRSHFVKVHLIPFFGKMPITEVTRTSIQDFIAAKRANGWLGPRQGAGRFNAENESPLPPTHPRLRGRKGLDSYQSNAWGQTMATHAYDDGTRPVHAS